MDQVSQGVVDLYFSNDHNEVTVENAVGSLIASDSLFGNALRQRPQEVVQQFPLKPRVSA